MTDGLCYSYLIKEISIKLFIIKVNKFKKKIKLSTDGILHFDVKRTYLVNYIEMALGSREVFIALYCI